MQVTQRLGQYPAIITVAEMGAARHFLKTVIVEKDWVFPLICVFS